MQIFPLSSICRLKGHQQERDREESVDRLKGRKRHDSGRRSRSPARRSSHRKDDGKNGGEEEDRRAVHQHHGHKRSVSVSPAESPHHRRERNQNFERDYRDNRGGYDNRHGRG